MEKIDHLEKTLAEIKDIDPAKGRSIMTDYDNFLEEFQRSIKIKTVSVSLQKAEICYDIGKETEENECLLNAYSTIKESGLGNEDLRTANLKHYTNGTVLTLEAVEQRLMALGWNG